MTKLYNWKTDMVTKDEEWGEGGGRTDKRARGKGGVYTALETLGVMTVVVSWGTSACHTAHTHTQVSRSKAGDMQVRQGGLSTSTSWL